MNKIPAAEHLTDKEYNLLMAIQNKHINSMGNDSKESHSDITKVERNVKEKCFHVHYSNGEWYKYYVNGTWG